MQQLSGEVGDGLLTPSITTPAFVRYARENMLAGASSAGRDGDELDLGCTIVASIAEDRDEGRDGAREIAGMYLANKVQNIRGSADTLLDLAGLDQEEIRPVADAMEARRTPGGQGEGHGRDPRQVQADRRNSRRLHRGDRGVRDAGCTHVMLELWGADRHRQIELFGQKVLPRFA